MAIAAESEAAYTQRIGAAHRCLICSEPLTVRLARGRKSGKPFVMFLCLADPRHFRAFVNHQPYVQAVLDQLAQRTALGDG